MASTEEKAYEIMRELDVSYVLVIFGGLTGYSSDGMFTQRCQDFLSPCWICINSDLDYSKLFELETRYDSVSVL